MMPVGPRIMATSFEEFRNIQQRKKTVIEKMCAALCEYLTFDVNLSLEAEEQKPTGTGDYGPVPFTGPQRHWTADDLMEVQTHVEAIQKRIDKMQEAIDTAPIPQMVVLLETCMLPTLQHDLRTATEHRDWLQKELEKQAQPATAEVVDLTGEPA